MQDCSPAPLFSAVDPSVMSMPIYVALSALYDNYVASPATVEDHTEEEHEEEMTLLEVNTALHEMIFWDKQYPGNHCN